MNQGCSTRSAFKTVSAFLILDFASFLKTMPLFPSPTIDAHDNRFVHLVVTVRETDDHSQAMTGFYHCTHMCSP